MPKKTRENSKDKPVDGSGADGAAKELRRLDLLSEEFENLDEVDDEKRLETEDELRVREESEVESVIADLISQTPAEHRAVFSEVCQEIIKSLTKIGFNGWQRRSVVRSVWEDAWENWHGGRVSYHERQLQKKGIIGRIKIPSKDAVEAYGFKEISSTFYPTQIQIVSLVKLLDIATKHVIEKSTFPIIASMVSQHLTEIAGDIGLTDILYQTQ
jgi:hypothetical protein